MATVWLVELIHLRPWHAELYDLVIPGQSFVFDLWIVATIALLVGFRPRLAAAISFACFVLFFTLGQVIYHIDLVGQITTFYLMFIDSSAVWSVDSILRRRRGQPAKPRVWAFPVVMLLLHMSMVYLDAGLSHLMFNPSWVQGAAVWASWGHPQWTTILAAHFLGFPLLGQAATYATIAFELTFWLVAAWVLADLRARSRVAILCFTAILGLQLGIVISYDIGLFSPFMIAVAVPYLPWERLGSRAIDRTIRTDAIDATDGTDARGMHLIVAGLTVVVAMSLLATPPLVAWGESPSGPRIPVLILRTSLRLVGDVKPHNVFSDQVVGLVVSARILDTRGDERRVLFGDRSERIGDMTYVRGYMVVEQMLRDDVATPPEAYRVIRPFLQRAADRGELGAGTFTVVVRARARLPAGAAIEGRELFRFNVTPAGQVIREPDEARP